MCPLCKGRVILNPDPEPCQDLDSDTEDELLPEEELKMKMGFLRVGVSIWNSFVVGLVVGCFATVFALISVFAGTFGSTGAVVRVVFGSVAAVIGIVFGLVLTVFGTVFGFIFAIVLWVIFGFDGHDAGGVVFIAIAGGNMMGIVVGSIGTVYSMIFGLAGVIFGVGLAFDATGFQMWT